jgi:signal transduction histidine kinase
VELSVRDTGLGIADKDIPHIFERFHRIEGAQGRTHEGSGIGLAFVAELVKLHGGEVRVESKVGAGSVFTISIPLGSAHLPSGALRAEATAATGRTARGYVEEAERWSLTAHTSEPRAVGGKPAPERARILFAEDNADMREYVQRILEPDYDVVTVPDGEAALDALATGTYDLVLSDVMMPRLDGFGLVQRIRSDVQVRAMPVILVSARAGEDSSIEGLQAGADGYLVKPFSARELLVRVESQLAIARIRLEAAAGEREHRRQAELERSRAVSRASELQAIMDAVPAAIYITHDPECGNIVGNRAAYEWLRLPVTGQPIAPGSNANAPTPYRLLKDGAKIPVGQLPLQAAIRALQPITGYEYEVAFNDGDHRTLFGNAVPLVDEGGQARGAVAAFIDVTERRRIQERLLEAQRLESVGLLAGGIAHDFNNLLVPVVGFAALTRESLEPSHPCRPYLVHIEQAAERAAYLTKQLLAYAGKARFVMERVDIRKMVQETVALFEASAQKNIGVVVETDAVPSVVEADAGELRQVLMDLLRNAAEAIGEAHGTIRVRMGIRDIENPAAEGFPVAGEMAPGRYVSLKVSDTGAGMDEAVQAKIFEPFFSTKFLGRGLGLAAVAGIVRAHNWGLRVESAPGKGSRFELVLGAEAAVPKQTEPAPAETVPGAAGAYSVLVVDDEEIVRRTAKLALERRGYQVFLAENGPAAIRLFRHEARQAGVVLLDLSMPGMSGQETLGALREIDPEVKVLISSGYSEQQAQATFAGQKTSGFVQKPFTPIHLAATIQKVLKE